MDIFKFILILLSAYLIGSLPFGFLAGKLIKRIDLRQEGSKNVGATNVFRVMGTLPAIVVLLLDISKGLLSIHLPSLFNLGGSTGISPQTFTLVRILAGLAAIAGHNWTIFLTRYVSLSSMSAVLAFPLNCLLFKESLILVFFGSFIALVVVVRHQANIKRLIAGTENRIEWVRDKEKISNF